MKPQQAQLRLRLSLKLLPGLLIASLFLVTPLAHAKTFKIATLSPDGSFWMQQMRKGAEEIEKQTDGRVKFKFYPGGVMGDNKAVLRKIKIGQLQGGALTGGSLSPYFSDNQIYMLTMKYRDQEEINYIRPRIDPQLIEGMEKNGFVTFGIAEGGFVYMMSTKQPVTSVAQLQKQKAWIPANDQGALEMIQQFDVSPIPLPLGDVLAGLQTGLIDTVAISPIGAIALQWHTQIKYFTKLPLLYSYGVLAINNKAFTKEKPADQKIIRDIMNSTFKVIDAKNKKDNVEAMAALQSQGIKFVEPNETEVKEWRQYGSKAQKRMVDAGLISTSLNNKVDQLLTEYRNKRKNNHHARVTYLTQEFDQTRRQPHRWRIACHADTGRTTNPATQFF